MASNWRNLLTKTITHQQIGIFALVFVIILLSLLLAGCTSAQSSTLLNIYLVSLSYRGISDTQDLPQHALVNSGLADTFKSLTNATSLEVRIGYFALCFRQTGSGWTCGNDPLALMRQIHSGQDPANLVWQSADFKDTTIFYGFILATIVLLVLIIGFFANLPGWRAEIDENDEVALVKGLPSMSLIIYATVVSFFASALALLSMVWQHVASSAFITAVQNMTYGGVRGNVGVAGLVLGWLAVATTICISAGIGGVYQTLQIAEIES